MVLGPVEAFVGWLIAEDRRSEVSLLVSAVIVFLIGCASGSDVVGAFCGIVAGLDLLFLSVVVRRRRQADAYFAAFAELDRRALELLAEAPDAPPSFVCPECGARSFHPDDVAFGYCGRCHRFTGDRR